MPRGKEFCPYENDFFAVAAFKVVGGTRLHNVEPLHRATDGMLVKIEGDKVVEIDPVDAVIDAMEEEE
jgi:hypothetical protein